MQRLSSDQPESWLIWFFKGLLVLGFLFLLTRLAELQIIKGAYYRDLAENNRIRKVPILASRGNITARGGQVIVSNKEIQKTIVFQPENGFEKVEANENTPKDEVITEPIRDYKMGAEAGHIVGFLGEVNEEEVGKIDPDCPDKGALKLGGFVGRGGLEEKYECILRGVDGEEMFEVDSMGRKVRLIGRRSPVSGQDLSTTIDYGLQKKTAVAMKDAKGAVVISDGNGQILALYSSPSYDPNLFINPNKENSKKISDLFSNKDLPLFNRTIGGAYHPGSIFKLVTATAALEDEKITNDFTYEDTGIITVNDFSYTNWYYTQYGSTEGTIDLKRSLARSTDTFFYKVGEMVGADRLVWWAKKFGLGENTGIDIPGEISGLVPSPEWKKAVKGEKWFLGNTYHMSIGQGDLTVTPLSGNIMTSVIANGGKLCKPHLAVGENTCTDLKIKADTIKEIRAGMIGACSTGGTAFPFFDFPVPVACKTGTAETEEEDKTHAWFTIFAPAENPELVVTVIVEKGGEGSKVAAPIAREILQYWWQQKNP